jgi:hypothetical protein
MPFVKKFCCLKPNNNIENHKLCAHDLRDLHYPNFQLIGEENFNE